MKFSSMFYPSEMLNYNTLEYIQILANVVYTNLLKKKGCLYYLYCFFDLHITLHMVQVTQRTKDVLRFLYRVGGPSLSRAGGGCVRAKRMSSGMKSLWREVGRGLVLSIAIDDRSCGSLTTSEVVMREYNIITG